MLILHCHSHVAVKCRAAYIHLRVFFIPFATSFPALKNFSLLNYLLFLYLIMLMSFLLLTSAKSYTAYFKILFSASLIMFVNTTIYISVLSKIWLTQDLATFYSPPVLSCIFSPSLLYIWDVSLNSKHHSSFNPLVTRYQATCSSPYISPLNSVSLSPTPLSNILIPFLI